jgi:hypothetical protein
MKPRRPGDDPPGRRKEGRPPPEVREPKTPGSLERARSGEQARAIQEHGRRSPGEASNGALEVPLQAESETFNLNEGTVQPGRSD